MSRWRLPWRSFQRSRQAQPRSYWRDFYAWSETPEKYREARIIFQDFEPSNWTAYFGRGDECYMAFHFPLMPRLFMARHTEDRFPIVDILAQTPPIPETSQGALVLRNHDELTLEMVTEEERLYLPLIVEHKYHHESIHVEAQQRNPHSLLWWMRRLITLRSRHPAFGRGSLELIHPDNRRVLAFLRRYREEQLLAVANPSRFTRYVELDLAACRGFGAVELFGRTALPPIDARPYGLPLARPGTSARCDGVPLNRPRHAPRAHAGCVRPLGS
jgi:Maltogenic Amylase, C-terminal domain